MLGSVELQVSELIQDPPAQSPVSKKQFEEPLLLDTARGATRKGKIHYDAEFIPVLAAKSVEFSGEAQLTAQPEQSDVKEEVAKDSEPSPSEKHAQAVSDRDTAKNQPSEDAAGMNEEKEKEKETSETGEEATKNRGTDLRNEELLKQRMSHRLSSERSRI